MHADIELADLASVKSALEPATRGSCKHAAMHHWRIAERDPEKAFATNGTGARIWRRGADLNAC